MIDGLREPTGQQPIVEGDEAEGDDEDVKDVLPGSSCLSGLPNTGSQCLARISTVPAEGLTLRRKPIRP